MSRKTCLPSKLLFAFSTKTFLLFLLHAIGFAAAAQGNLLVTPKRIVFDGNRRSEDINLANVGQDSATYAISFVQIRMNEDGSFQRIEKPDSGQLFAEPFLRIFPRTVTLAPNEAQTIKLQVRRTGDMQPGEYRSHLYLRAVPRQTPLGEKSTGGDSSISVKLIPIFGISIPVIVRVGEYDAQVQLSDVALHADSIPSVHMAFQRKGNMSVYGDITVNHVSKQGKVTQVGAAKGLAVYAPNPLRQFNLLLDKSARVNYHSGKLQVVFSEQSLLSSKPATLTEKEIELH